MMLIDQARAVAKRRQVLATLVRRDLRVRYARSVLGYLWTILDPLAMAMVYFVVFTKILKARQTGFPPYILFLLVGLLAWQWFSQSMTETARALLSEAKLVRSTNLPRELWVVRVVIAKGIEFLLSLPVLAAFFLYYFVQGEAHLYWAILLFPVGMVMQFLLIIGLGLILAPVTTLVTDTSRVVRIVLRMGFYATPVLYSIDNAPKSLRLVLAFNPMTGVIELYRAGFWADQIRLLPVLIGAALTILALVVGVVVFRRLEPAILKEI